MIVTVVNVKGGVAKTTTAMALATAASRDGLDTRVLDGDPQATATAWWQMAGDNGEDLPFEVSPTNRAHVSRIGRTAGDGVTIVDCPPNGDLVDASIKAADFVVIPSTPAPVDLQQTILTAATCEDAGKPCAVLIVMARAGTVSLKTFRETVGRDFHVFDTEIPLKEDVKFDFGHRFRSNLYGYEDVWREIKREVNA